MKRIIAAAALVFSAFSLLAQAPKVKSDPSAKQVLDQVSAKFQSYNNVKAGFTLTIEDATGKVDGRKKGTVSMKGTKYRILMGGQDIICDGATTWSYDKSTNEVKIETVDPGAATITPQKLFTDFYDKDFLYKLNGTAKVSDKPAQEIELTPNDKTKPFFKVLVYVDKATRNIVSTKVFEKDGTRFTYTVNTFSANTAAVTDKEFVFDPAKYPGVEVVDLR